MKLTLVLGRRHLHHHLPIKWSAMRPRLLTSCFALTLGIAALTLSACDDTITVPNNAPTAEITAYCSADDRTWFFIELSDAEGEPVSIDLIIDGQRVPAGPTGDGLVGLRTDAHVAIEHPVEWGQTCADCPDVCAAGPGPSYVDGCNALQGTPPAQVTVIAHLDDGANQVVLAPMSLTLGDCPE